MAGKDLSLKIAVKLLTDNFKKGTASMLAGLRSLQYRILAFSSALGLGTVGLTHFVSKMRDVAKETTSAVTALKNVSGSAAAFASNTKWLSALADKYGVAINTLTLGFAKFKAAADIANMAAEDQRKIFESVARTTVAFGLNSEDQRGVFMALQQMMSKGKVMAEELRLQLAERMPVAIQAMAAAAGVSVNQLDKIMKQGKVLSAEVLPKFAEELERMIPNVDLDNLNKSLTDLGNTFVELTKKMNFTGIFKGLVDVANLLLKKLLQNSTGTVLAIGSLFAGGLVNGIRKGFNLIVSISDDATKAQEAQTKSLRKSRENDLKAFLALKRKEGDYEVAQSRVVAARETGDEQRIQQAILDRRKVYREVQKARMNYSAAATKYEKEREAFAAEGGSSQAAVAGIGRISKAWNGLGIVIKRVGTIIKGAIGASIWSIAASGVTFLIGKFVQLVSEARKYKKIVETTKEELEKPIETPVEETDLRQSVKNLSSSDDNVRAGALKQINSLLGTEYKLQSLNAKKIDEIAAKSERYIKFLRAQAELEQARLVVAERQADYDKLPMGRKVRRVNERGETTSIATDAAYTRKENAATALRDAKADVAKWSEEVAKGAAEFISEITTKDDSSLPSAPTAEGTPLQRMQEQYAERMQELATELANGLITEREYQRAKKDLIEKTYIQAAASGDKDILGSSFYGDLGKEFGGFSHGELREREEAVEDMLIDYGNELAALNRQQEQKLLTEEEYRKALAAVTKRYYEELSSIDARGLDPKIITGIALGKLDAQSRNKIATTGQTPAQATRRSLIDSLRTGNVEKIELEISDAEKQLEALKSIADSSIVGLIDQIAAAQSKVDSLAEKLELAKAEEMLKGLRKDIAVGAWDGLQTGVQGVDSIVSSIENLQSVMNDSDASGWDKFMAGFDVLAQTANTIITVVQAIQVLASAIQMLQAVKDAQAAKEKAQASEEVARNTATAASEGGKSVMKELPFPLNVLAIAGVIAAVIGAFAAIPKFAQGGIVGEGPRRGDKVLARLNRGEGVLTERGLEGLGDISGAQGGTLNVRISGKLKASGRDLELVLDQQQRFRNRTK